MPCNNVTELLQLKLDEHDRVIDYSLYKETCGGRVAGRGLIRSWVKLKTPETILALEPGELLAAQADNGDTSEYLQLKHLFSIQAALAALTGVDDPTDGFLQIESVQYGSHDVVLQARIDLEMLTEKIKACGLCGDACRGALEK